MKRLFALLLAVTMLLSLAACAGTTAPETEAPSTAESETKAPETEAPATEAPATEAPTEAATEAPAADGTLSEEEQAVYDLIFGYMKGENYLNEMLGLGIEIDDDWVLDSQETILANNGFVADGTLIAQIEAAPLIMIMNAVDQEDGSSVNINAEELPAPMSEEEYVTAQLDDTKAALEQMELTNVDVALDTVTVAGTAHSCMQVACEIQGIPFFETVIAYALPDDTMAAITVSAFEKDEIADIIEEIFVLPAA